MNLLIINKNMARKLIILFIFCIFAFNGYAQEVYEEIYIDDQIDSSILSETEEIKQRGDFWIALNGDTAFFSQNGVAYGGGLSFGYGTGSSIGLKVAWFFGTEEVDTLEINLLLRFYLFGSKAYSGPFIQLSGGPAIFFKSGEIEIPSYMGMVSGGLSAGWRFILKDRWYIEPAIRGGYPFMAGATVTIGIRN